MYRPLNLLLFSAAAVLGAQPQERAKTPSKTPVVRVSIELTPSAKEISADSSCIFKITITNLAKFTLYIYKDLEFGTTVFMQDSKHRDIPQEIIGDLCPPPPPPPGANETIFMPIEPGKSVSTIYNRSLSDLGVHKPGQYFATAYYYRYLTTDPKHAFPALRDVPLISTPIEITVK